MEVKETNEGRKGGILKGDSHSDKSGGIKAVVTDNNNKPVLLEGGEVVINKKAVNDSGVKTITGTNKEILNKINTSTGGVQIFDDGGKIGIVDTSTCDSTDCKNRDNCFKKSELMKGIDVEKEHQQTFDKLYAHEITVEDAVRETAEEHLSEDADYYSKLKDMERFEYGGILKSMQQSVNEKRDTLIIDASKKIDSIENEILLFENEKSKTNDISKKSFFNQKNNLLKRELIFYKNRLKAYNKGGFSATFKDKKGVEHIDVPVFEGIKSDNIFFNEETILTDNPPDYVPFIDENVFKQKGYVFDAIRIEKDTYIIAVNGYNEFQKIDYSETIDIVGKTPNDGQQGYVILTLDQLVLTNEYYFAKAKSLNQKNADEKNKYQENYYDKIPIERRESILSQKGFYFSLPKKIQDKITKEQYETLSIYDKEKLYKPYKRYGAERIKSKLGEKKMWKSFHEMYERFINPDALPTDRFGNTIKITGRRTNIFGNREVFNYWYALVDMMKWKLNDVKVQREIESEIRKIALETSFGEANTNNILKEKYGILVKRQNGTKIQPNEIEQIRNSFDSIQSMFGNISGISNRDNLKISHTADKYVFASKASGMYIPKFRTIAVTNKFGDDKFQSIMAHEIAHYIDNKLGEKKGKRYFTDDYEGNAGVIAYTFRKLMNKRSESDYINATKECFARALEQYFSIEKFGIDVTYSDFKTTGEIKYIEADSYVNKLNYNEIIKPLIIKFLQEEQDFFKYSVEKLDNIKTTKMEENYKSDFEIGEQKINSALLTGNRNKVDIAVNELFLVVKSNPKLYPDFLKRMYSIPKKNRIMLNPYLPDIGQKSIADYLNSKNINLFELLPVKDFILPKFKHFETTHENTVFMGIHSEFTGKDKLRLVFLGTNFNENGVVTTNAHALLFTKYRGKKEQKYGNYCHTKLCFDNISDVESSKFPDWQRVIPDNTNVVKINADYLYDFVKNSVELGVLNPITKEISFDFEDGYISFNASLFLASLDAMFKLGHTNLEINFGFSNSRAALIVPAGMSDYVKKYDVDFCLLMPLMRNETKEGEFVYNLENNCVRIIGNEKEFCFNKETLEKEKISKKLGEIDTLRAELDALKNKDVEKEKSNEQKQESSEITKTIEEKRVDVVETESDELSEIIFAIEALNELLPMSKGKERKEIMFALEALKEIKAGYMSDGGILEKLGIQANVIEIKGESKENEPKFEKGGKIDKEGTKIQTLIMDKTAFRTALVAKKWAKRNNFETPKIHRTKNSFRIRQIEPEKFNQDSFKTIKITDGVKAVIGYLK